ncbi:catalytic phage domain protein : Site-specific recombinase XerD OS=Singulisphaera acidiphila (strain ATCC BAA-1392 / DSM 18658 / VKM B-2454 / MOB10) GN=Sinac_1635 PE=4 SV=1 [Gemmata massiliana]|uniref:Catalytic phage domain protein: Site-specific recombinase XerD n=1 Tax=Gemmata massiliana TaxID=1210884 RepID=A0A6P2DDI0_9BACT|nr:hypothetical protein [Gemmata massiliana]VTR97620.1 catalytic phage domain protein : Site-specific recombinase XerD OS=Singulisphaera acidiphila (strain ATCC BAA-1392 / DSM 18658 / VKM B-2454 / MOB10) GN=Sinac_1635 PE=4 SV=1 [Gemmata massiliana]
MLLAFLRYAEPHYRSSGGKTTHEVFEIRRSVWIPALATVRQAMIDANWCRTLINRRMERIKRAFKWAASQELVPVSVHQGYPPLTGLRKSRTEARESAPVKPVDPAHVAAVLPYLSSQIRTMIELQRLTRMRPSEVCAITLAEVDRTSETWATTPRNTSRRTGARARDPARPEPRWSHSCFATPPARRSRLLARSATQAG